MQRTLNNKKFRADYAIIIRSISIGLMSSAIFTSSMLALYPPNTVQGQATQEIVSPKPEFCPLPQEGILKALEDSIKLVEKIDREEQARFIKKIKVINKKTDVLNKLIEERDENEIAITGFIDADIKSIENATPIAGTVSCGHLTSDFIVEEPKKEGWLKRTWRKIFKQDVEH
jgi:hypothetical protein